MLTERRLNSVSSQHANRRLTKILAQALDFTELRQRFSHPPHSVIFRYRFMPYQMLPSASSFFSVAAEFGLQALHCTPEFFASPCQRDAKCRRWSVAVVKESTTKVRLPPGSQSSHVDFNILQRRLSKGTGTTAARRTRSNEPIDGDLAYHVHMLRRGAIRSCPLARAAPKSG